MASNIQKYNDYLNSTSFTMDPLIGGALISAGGSLLGNLFGNSAQKQANKLTYKMFQEGNQFNREERISAQNWQKQMLDYQNAYNTPLEQRKRMQDAGYNPYLSQIAPNLSAGASSSPQASSAGAGSIGAYKPDMSGISQAANMLYQSPLQRTQVDKIYSDKELNEAKTIGQTIENAVASGSKEARIKAYQLANDETQHRIDNLEAEKNYKKALTDVTLLDKQAKVIMNSFLTESQQVELLKKYEELNNLRLQGKLTDAEVKKTIAQTIREYTNNEIDKKNLYILTNTAESTIKAQNAQNEDLYNQVISRGPDYWDTMNLATLTQQTMWYMNQNPINMLISAGAAKVNQAKHDLLKVYNYVKARAKGDEQKGFLEMLDDYIQELLKVKN